MNLCNLFRKRKEKAEYVPYMPGQIFRFDHLDILTMKESEFWSRNILPFGWSIISEPKVYDRILCSDCGRVHELQHGVDNKPMYWCGDNFCTYSGGSFL